MDAAEKPKRNWMKIVLIGSLALNLLIVGLVVGAMMRFDKGHGRHFDRVSMGMGLFIQALPEDARKQVKASGGPYVGNFRAFRKEMRVSQKRLETAILATPFSEEAVRAAISARRDFALGATAQVQDAFVSALSGLSVEERATFNARVETLRKERKSRRHGKKRRE